VTALNRSLGQVTLVGKIVIPLLVLVLVVGPLATVFLATVVGPQVANILASNMGIVRFVVAITAILLFSIPAAFIIIYMELKVIAYMNLRVGPNRVLPAGAAHSVVAGLKVLSKEDFTPNGADRLVFTWAPVLVFLTAVMTFMVVPFGPGLVGAPLNIGLLYLFGVGGMSVVGLLLAGWSSFNKYSLLGGLRSAAQVVSYEIPLTLSVVGLILLAGTLSIDSIARQQAGWFWDWFVVRQPLGALIFFIAGVAEANRTPFDLTEADSEIVAGFATEYSGMRFGFLFFAEYVNVFIMSALIVTMFFGAWNAPVDINAFLAWVANIATWVNQHVFNATAAFTLGPIGSINLDPGRLGLGLLLVIAVAPLLVTLALAAPFYMRKNSLPAWKSLVVGFILFNVLVTGALGLIAYVNWDWVAGLIWFMVKAFAFVFVFVWMRGTFPRVRIDQLMGFAWKWLLPAAMLNLFVTALAIILIDSLHKSGVIR